MLEDNMPLPPLRNELRIDRAQNSLDGRHRWRLYDPISHRYFLFEEADISLLTQWDTGTVGALKLRFKAMNLGLDYAQLEGLLSFLHQHELLSSNTTSSLSTLKKKYLSNTSIIGWRQLFDKFRTIRRPLVHSEPILRTIAPIFTVFSHKICLLIWLVITLAGVYFASRQWDEFINTAHGFFNITGMVAFGLVLFVIKCFHELGHGYLAYHYGCRVGRIGIATFFFFPILYTELDDVSRLNSSRQKMLIASGGVLTEILIAGIATFFWAALSDGLLRNITFIISTTCWTTSVLINLNPLAKFDGYYILSDLLKIENLQSRSLAWTSWFIDRIVLGRGIEVPEKKSILTRVAFISFGTGTWFYQIFLLFSVSYMLYTILLPAIGIIVFIAVIITYVITPVINRLFSWASNWSASSLSRKIISFLTILGMLTGLFIPLDHSLSLPSITRGQQLAVIRAPEEALIDNWYVPVNHHAHINELIVRLSSPVLEKRIAIANVTFQLAKAKLDRVAGGEKEREYSLVLEEELEQAKTHLQGLIHQRNLLFWRANSEGLIVDTPIDLQEGQWVSKDAVLGRLIDPNKLEGFAYIPEREVGRIKVGATAYFYPSDPSWPLMKSTLVEVEQSAIDKLKVDELNKIYGGSIPTTRNKEGESIPIEALHLIRFSIVGSSLPNQVQLSGELVVNVEPESIAEQIWRNLWGLLLTELRR